MRVFWLAIILGIMTLGCGAPVAERPPATAMLTAPVIVRDDFDTVDTSIFGGGHAFPGGMSELSGGTYALTVDAGQGWRYQWPSHNYPSTYRSQVADGVAETVLSLRGVGTAGLVARSAETAVAGAGTHWDVLACWVSTWGAAGCEVIVNDQPRTLFATEADWLAPAATYDLRMDVVGDLLGFSVNGRVVGTTQTTALATGKWGLWVSSTNDAPATGVFESYILTATRPDPTVP